MMKTTTNDPTSQPGPQDLRHSRRARLHVLLFHGAALAAAVLMSGGGTGKWPRGSGE